MEETVKFIYYSVKYKPNLLELTKKKMYKFIGILILSGHHTIFQEGLYWPANLDMGPPLFQKYMFRNKPTTIRQNLNLADNISIDTADRLKKSYS